ncbi:MAG TPA: lipopolysaccharide transport periplasmic protein LptA, partial [Thermodesulfobacteriota bacterium]|nr:lipopolysaccharide transport periplasmic protein LptA [Thermodesulfobacteriota bacterium]
KRDYFEALKKFEELKASFPDSPPYTVWAELKIGDCHFFKKEYVEAIAAYEEFKKVHPSHEELPYVQYQIGMSYFNQMRSHDRDQTPTKMALSSFEYLIANYPPGLFSEKAKEKIVICKRRLADHEFNVGDFYYKHGKFQSAAWRFEGLLQTYPKNPGEDETLYLLGKSYLELDQWSKAEVAFMKIVTDYPKSPHYKEAKAILDKGMPETKVSTRKAKGSKKKGEIAEKEPEGVALVKFEEEGKQPVSLGEEKKAKVEGKEERLIPLPVSDESVKPVPPKEEAKKPSSSVTIGSVPAKEETKETTLSVTGEPVQEDRTKALPPSTEVKKTEPSQSMELMKEDQSKAFAPPVEVTKTDPSLPVEPMKEGRTQAPPSSAQAVPRIEVKPDEEKRVAALILPGTAAPSQDKEKGKPGAPPETKEAKFVDANIDRSQPIDITSDKVEAFWKENLIIFKGNVVARQKDIVIYADSMEAIIVDDGKGIDRATAGGNVKIQQGLRVANCQKAIFYNRDQKMVLTGEPRIVDGDNTVSGDEIIFDIEKNRVEVKGGQSGRGKAKVQPGGEIEKLK